MRFRILRFRPKPAAERSAAGPRPRPAITHDIAFFFEGARQGKLLIQRCAACGTLRHPPARPARRAGPSSGTPSRRRAEATVYSFVVVHHPQVPGFDYPCPSPSSSWRRGRGCCDLIGVDPADVRIGMPVEVEISRSTTS